MKKPLIITAAIILIAAAVYFYYYPSKNILEVLGIKKPAIVPGITGATTGLEDLTTKTPISGSFVKQAAIVQDANGFPLMPGSSNGYVKKVQQALNDRFGSELVVDGIYGTKTEKALSAHGFQSTIYYAHYYNILGITV